MKAILLSIFFVINLSGVLWAQQEPHYTHFMFNKLAFNPAYAGSKDVGSVSVLYRSQWAGMIEAPQTQTIYGHTPLFHERVGMGFGIIHDTHGVTADWRANLSYAYRIKVANGSLAMGLQGSIHAQQVRWTDLVANEPDDIAVPLENKSKYLPNFGGGLYYQSKSVYAGVSIPNMLQNSLVYYENPSDNADAKEVRHLYAMAGTIFGDKIRIKPGILFKYAKNTPFDFDANVSVLFEEKFWIGATYRLEDAIAALVGFRIGHQISLGVSYDYTLSALNDFNNGSFEVFAEYLFQYKNSKFTNPRFFF